jgi:hypothetical protein
MMKSLSMFAAAAVIAAGGVVLASSADARSVRQGHRHIYRSLPYIEAIPYLGGLPHFGGYYGRYYGDWGHSGPSDRFQFQGDYD